MERVTTDILVVVQDLQLTGLVVQITMYNMVVLIMVTFGVHLVNLGRILLEELAELAEAQVEPEEPEELVV